MQDNELTTVPESVGNLKNLTSLDIYRNCLTALPKSIEKLKNLGKLYGLEENLFSDEELSNIEDLCYSLGIKFEF